MAEPRRFFPPSPRPCAVRRALVGRVALALAALALPWGPAPAAQGLAPPGSLASVAAPDPPWRLPLQQALAGIRPGRGVDLGIHVLDLASGATVDLRSHEHWYLASMVKLPVAIAVLRGVEAGQFTLDTTLRLRADDRVDGAGTTNAQPIAAALPLRFLLEQMMAASDNTASDMLIDLVGLEAVNAVVASLVPTGFGRITTLADVRRQVYGQLTPMAGQLRGSDLLRLHALPSDNARLELLSQLVGVPVAQFRRPTLDAAYAAYYRTGLNAARLDAYGQLLAAVVQGRALGPAQTAWLLALMERTRTGSQRIKAGLPEQARFAHKTGTQRERTCDAGLVRAAGTPPEAGAVVVACVRGEASLARAEALLREVGLALCRAGLLDKDTPHHATSCPVPFTTPAGAEADAAAGAAAGAGRGPGPGLAGGRQ